MSKKSEHNLMIGIGLLALAGGVYWWYTAKTPTAGLTSTVIPGTVESTTTVEALTPPAAHPTAPAITVISPTLTALPTTFQRIPNMVIPTTPSSNVLTQALQKTVYG